LDWLWKLDQAGLRALAVDGRREWLTPLVKIISDTGLGHVQLFIVLLCCIRAGWRRVVLLAALGGALGGLIRLGIMRLADRQRPGNFDFVTSLHPTFLEPGFPMGNSSFPSGHTTTSFGIAWMLWLLLRKTDHEWVAISAFVWASLVGLSRVYLGVHYPLDIVGGVLMGGIGAGTAYVIAYRRGWLPEAATEPR
jgi:membrane-associated phospholipid phosphatase